MPINGLRVALFSGNYNYVRDGANQALNRLVDYLERGGAKVRVYSPTTSTPAFEPKGTLVSVPSFAIPGRNEYRVALGLTHRLQRDIIDFSPDIIHLSAPDLLGKAAQRLAGRNNIPCVASVHTRFDTYLAYYKLKWLEDYARDYMRKFYRQCAAIFAPCKSMSDSLQEDNIAENVGIWGRGVDAGLFNPNRRSAALRKKFGFDDADVVVAFVGRIVREKGIDLFAETIADLRRRGHDARVIVVGDGPARSYFQGLLPDATFTGLLTADDLADAYACADIFFNPSTTETFGNVTTEAMASGRAIVCAKATGSDSLIQNNINGLVPEKNSPESLATCLEQLVTDADLRDRLGEQARQDALLRDWDSCLSGMANAYLQVLGKPVKPLAAPIVIRAAPDSVHTAVRAAP